MTRPTLARLRGLDAETWRAATWWSPVTYQLVFAATFGLGWLLSKWPFDPYTRFRTLALTPTVIVTVGSLLIAAASLSAVSPLRRGLGVAIAGSAVATLVFVLVYTTWMYPLWEPDE